MNRIPCYSEINNLIFNLDLNNFYSKSVIKHIGNFVHGCINQNFNGKLTQIHNNCFSKNHRTTLGHFLNNSPWDESILDKSLNDCIGNSIKSSTLDNLPVYLIIDDTINEKIKPSSRAKAPIQDTQYHMSHLKNKSVWGHQIVQSMIKTNDQCYPLHTEIFNKTYSKSKIDIAIDMINKMPILSEKTYLLCDSWYPSKSIIECALSKGIHTISAIKTNRLIYPKGIKQQAKEFAKYIRINDTDLVTINNESYHVYRYEGKLNLIDNADVLLSWKAKGSFEPKNMKAFLSTDIELSNVEILTHYQNRWSIEVYFKNVKQYLGFGGYQIRKIKSINRFLLLLKLTYCFVITNKSINFNESIKQLYYIKHCNIIDFIYYEALSGSSLDTIKKVLSAA